MLDIVTDREVMIASNLWIAENGTDVAIDAFDSADFAPGVTYYFQKMEEISAGTYRLFFLECDTVDGDYTEVPEESLSGSLEAAASAPVSNYGDKTPSVGVFSNKRFIKPALELMGGTGEEFISFSIFVAVKREILPYV